MTERGTGIEVVALFLASAAGAHVTGQVLHVNGGAHYKR